MFNDIQDQILTALGSSGFSTLAPFQGDSAELLLIPHPLPSAHLIFSQAGFYPPRTLGGTVSVSNQIWTLIILSKTARDPLSGDFESNPLIESVISALTRLNTGYGYVMPEKLDLISVKNGTSAYSLELNLEFYP